MKEVILVQEECIGCESCVEICEAMFGWNESEGVAFMKSQEGCDEETVQEAIDICPSSCIKWEE